MAKRNTTNKPKAKAAASPKKDKPRWATEPAPKRGRANEASKGTFQRLTEEEKAEKAAANA